MSYWQETPEQTWSKLETLYILARLGTTQCLPWWMDGWMDEICLFLGYLTTLSVLVLAGTDVVSVLSHLLTSVWPLFLMYTINDHSWAVLLSLSGYHMTPQRPFSAKTWTNTEGTQTLLMSRFPMTSATTVSQKNTHKPIKPPFSFIWLQTGGFKIHIKRCKWSNSV